MVYLYSGFRTILYLLLLLLGIIISVIAFIAAIYRFCPDKSRIR